MLLLIVQKYDVEQVLQRNDHFYHTLNNHSEFLNEQRLFLHLEVVLALLVMIDNLHDLLLNFYMVLAIRHCFVGHAPFVFCFSHAVSLKLAVGPPTS